MIAIRHDCFTKLASSIFQFGVLDQKGECFTDHCLVVGFFGDGWPLNLNRESVRFTDYSIHSDMEMARTEDYNDNFAGRTVWIHSYEKDNEE